MKHLRPILLSAASVLLLLSVIIGISLLLGKKPLMAPASMETEERIARIGAVILRTKLKQISNQGIYLQMKTQGEELLRNAQE